MVNENKDLVIDDTIRPLVWKERTNISEHKQMFNKINEIVDVVNTGEPRPVDEVPTKNSQRLVKSGGVYTAIENCVPKLEIDDIPMENSENLVKSGGVYSVNKQINIKANKALDVVNNADTTPTEGSTNLITSGAVYTSEKGLWDNEKQLLGIANRAQDTADAVKKEIEGADNAPTKDSPHLVKSGGTYDEINKLNETVETAKQKATDAELNAKESMNKAAASAESAKNAEEKANEALAAIATLEKNLESTDDIARNAQQTARYAGKEAAAAQSTAETAISYSKKQFVTSSLDWYSSAYRTVGEVYVISKQILVFDIQFAVQKDRPDENIFMFQLLKHVSMDRIPIARVSRGNTDADFLWGVIDENILKIDRKYYDERLRINFVCVLDQEYDPTSKTSAPSKINAIGAPPEMSEPAPPEVTIEAPTFKPHYNPRD